MRFSPLLALQVTLLSLLLSSAHAASFDCSKSRSEDEKAICADAELSRLDSEMAAAYKATADLIQGWKERAVPFRKNQLEWVKERAGCGATVSCLTNAYRQRIAWLKQPLHLWSGLWVGKRYSVSVGFDPERNRPTVRLFNAPRPADNQWMAEELQARFVAAKDNAQEGTEAVQFTPAFQAGFRQLDGQCSAISINFNTDTEAYLAVNAGCPLFRKNGDNQLTFKEVTYASPALR